MSFFKKSLLISLSLFTFSAWADFMQYQPYIGGSIGYAELGVGDKDLFGPTAIARNPALEPTKQSRDLDDATWRVHTGIRPVQLGQAVFGLELAYQDFGKAEYELTNSMSAPVDLSTKGYRDVEIQAVSFLMTAQYHYQRLFAFAKVGPAFARMKVKQDGVPDPRNPSLSKDLHTISKTYHNLVPEINFGFGAKVSDFAEVYVAYQELFGMGSSTTYGGTGVLCAPSEFDYVRSVAVGVNLGAF